MIDRPGLLPPVGLLLVHPPAQRTPDLILPWLGYCWRTGLSRSSATRSGR